MSSMPPNPFGSSPTPSPAPSPAPSPVQPPATSLPYHRYAWWEATLVALDSVLGLLFFWTGFGALFWLLGLAYVAWRDWRGLVSLRGIIPWGRYSRIVQIVLAIVLAVGAPVFFLVYSFQIVRAAFQRLFQGRFQGGQSSSFLGEQWARIRGWPRAWQVVGMMSALALTCACCASSLAVIGANSPTTNTGSAGSNNLAALTAPQVTATAQAAQAANAAQATATAQQIAFTSATATAVAQPTATATAIPTPTVAPTATPRPTPKPQPTKTPVPYVLSVTVTCASAVDYSYGQVCVHTHAYAQLTITVTYCSGYTAKSASLQGTVTANSSGNYTWNWTPETNCRGTADAYITDSWNGQYTSTDKSFTVQ